MIKCYIKGHDYKMTKSELRYMKVHGGRKYSMPEHAKGVIFKCSECGMIERKGYIVISEFDQQVPDESLLNKTKEKILRVKMIIREYENE